MESLGVAFTHAPFNIFSTRGISILHMLIPFKSIELLQLFLQNNISYHIHILSVIITVQIRQHLSKYEHAIW